MLQVSKKFQGVETPSQSRYVGYYEWVKNHDRQLPPEVPVRLTEIKVRGLIIIFTFDTLSTCTCTILGIRRSLQG